MSTLKNTTAAHYQNALRAYIVPAFGQWQVTSIGRIGRYEGETFLGEQAKKYSGNTLRSMRVSLSLLFSWAISWWMDGEESVRRCEAATVFSRTVAVREGRGPSFARGSRRSTKISGKISPFPRAARLSRLGLINVFVSEFLTTVAAPVERSPIILDQIVDCLFEEMPFLNQHLQRRGLGVPRMSAIC